MILELDTSLIKKLNISINQLVFISLVLNDNQKQSHQDLQTLLSQVKEEEIQELIQNNIITVDNKDNNVIYKVSEDFKKMLKQKADSMFDEFYNTFPVYVTRPDGTKGYLRANVNKCRYEYNKLIGKSNAMHEYLLTCLKYEIDDKMRTGKIGYMKTMWKWLTNHEWECYDEQMKDLETTNTCEYGTAIL